nr:MAG TPA: hypothetical protein [Caudoviricetes sp.]
MKYATERKKKDWNNLHLGVAQSQPLCDSIDRTGENSMSKDCRPMGLYGTYLDCMECEDKVGKGL